MLELSHGGEVLLWQKKREREERQLFKLTMGVVERPKHVWPHTLD